MVNKLFEEEWMCFSLVESVSLTLMLYDDESAIIKIIEVELLL